MSGQTGVDREARVVSADIHAQARQAIENRRQVLRASNSGLDRVLKVTRFLTDVNDRAAVAAIRREHRPTCASRSMPWRLLAPSEASAARLARSVRSQEGHT